MCYKTHGSQAGVSVSSMQTLMQQYHTGTWIKLCLYQKYKVRDQVVVQIRNVKLLGLICFVLSHPDFLS